MVATVSLENRGDEMAAVESRLGTDAKERVVRSTQVPLGGVVASDLLGEHGNTSRGGGGGGGGRL